MWASGLSDEARKAVNAAFDAMSTWRIETASNSEKISEEVIEKMAAAAQALGWPEQIVDATRAQLQSITKMQIQMMDQMMDAWEEQIRSPNPMTAPSAMLSKLKSLPSVSPAGTWAGAAKTSFVTKCKREACEPKAVGSDGKPLKGAAKNSFMAKCQREQA